MSAWHRIKDWFAGWFKRKPKPKPVPPPAARDAFAGATGFFAGATTAFAGEGGTA